MDLGVLLFWSQCRYDRVRGVEIGNKDIKLEYLEEAFTTSNWIVRIYKVKPPKNRSWGSIAGEVFGTLDEYIIVKIWVATGDGAVLIFATEAPQNMGAALARLTVVAVVSVLLKVKNHLSPHLV
jgi:hypothetical protein